MIQLEREAYQQITQVLKASKKSVKLELPDLILIEFSIMSDRKVLFCNSSRTYKKSSDTDLSLQIKSKKFDDQIIDFCSRVKQGLKDEDAEVKTSFGLFKTKIKPGIEGKNPVTGKAIKINQASSLTLEISSEFAKDCGAEALNKG